MAVSVEEDVLGLDVPIDDVVVVKVLKHHNKNHKTNKKSKCNKAPMPTTVGQAMSGLSLAGQGGERHGGGMGWRITACRQEHE